MLVALEFFEQAVVGLVVAVVDLGPVADLRVVGLRLVVGQGVVDLEAQAVVVSSFVVEANKLADSKRLVVVEFGDASNSTVVDRMDQDG